MIIDQRFSFVSLCLCGNCSGLSGLGNADLKLILTVLTYDNFNIQELFDDLNIGCRMFAWRKRTEFTSGNLIEHWRGTEEGRALEKLLSWQPEMLNVSIEIEFSDTIKLLNERMIKQQQQQARQRLESKPFAEWSAEEKLNYSKSLRSE